MTSVTFFKFRFTPSWLMLVLTIVFGSLFFRLGFWQLQRADEKKKMIIAQQMQELKPPYWWRDPQKLPVQYEQLLLKGTYLPQFFLLDNQHHQHQFGYHVLSPFKLHNGSVVIVDRGWVPGDVTRRSFPDINTPEGLIEIQGSAYFPSNKQWVLGPALEKKGSKLVILERLDTQLISQALQKVVSPFIIRLDKHNSSGFVCEWVTVSMPPQRHLAYAVQWFALASVVLILFVALNLKKKNEETSS